MILGVLLYFAMRADPPSEVGRVAELPANWPVPELGLPPGAITEYVERPIKSLDQPGVMAAEEHTESDGINLTKWKFG